MIVVRKRNLGVGPMKIAQVCDLVRGRSASHALEILRYTPKREIALALTKLINSALAQAVGKYDLEKLHVSELFVTHGKTLKRIRPRAQGRAFRIRKRSGHITLQLKEF
jgi:large subunit ribosomal protein L22